MEAPQRRSHSNLTVIRQDPAHFQEFEVDDDEFGDSYDLEDESVDQSVRAEIIRERNAHRQEQLGRKFKELTYSQIKQILIRLKSRKFLTQQCAVCLEAVANQDRCRMLTCYHIFHSECIMSWFSSHVTCPVCKKDFAHTTTVNYDQQEFIQTINVDNECFFSDHLLNS